MKQPSHQAQPVEEHQQEHQYEVPYEQQHGHQQPAYARARGWSDDGMSESEHKESGWNKVARIVCAVLLPPLGVFLQVGCTKDLAINALLTVLGYLPGIIHALFVILAD